MGPHEALERLGLSPSASSAEIESAYEELLRVLPAHGGSAPIRTAAKEARAVALAAAPDHDTISGAHWARSSYLRAALAVGSAAWIVACFEAILEPPDQVGIGALTFPMLVTAMALLVTFLIDAIQSESALFATQCVAIVSVALAVLALIAGGEERLGAIASLAVAGGTWVAWRRTWLPAEWRASPLYAALITAGSFLLANGSVVAPLIGLLGGFFFLVLTPHRLRVWTPPLAVAAVAATATALIFVERAPPASAKQTKHELAVAAVGTHAGHQWSSGPALQVAVTAEGCGKPVLVQVQATFPKPLRGPRVPPNKGVAVVDLAGGSLAPEPLVSLVLFYTKQLADLRHTRGYDILSLAPGGPPDLSGDERSQTFVVLGNWLKPRGLGSCYLRLPRLIEAADALAAIRQAHGAVPAHPPKAERARVVVSTIRGDVRSATSTGSTSGPRAFVKACHKGDRFAAEQIDCDEVLILTEGWRKNLETVLLLIVGALFSTVAELVVQRSRRTSVQRAGLSAS